MKLTWRIWLWLALLTALILAIDLGISHWRLAEHLRAETEYNARTVYGFLMATRRIYQQQFLASGI
ncbi:MAG: hypothetical protein N2690_05765, partial [Rhodocyclaceae bacterium]|nr:hypothetical protein [Rhodocyclaceae bacterium]